MEDFVHDLPLSVDFKQGEQISEPETGPVIQFQSHRCYRVYKVYAGGPRFEFRRRAILIIPVKEILNGACE